MFWMVKYEFPQDIVTFLLSILPDDDYKVWKWTVEMKNAGGGGGSDLDCHMIGQLNLCMVNYTVQPLSLTQIYLRMFPADFLY